VPHDDSRFVWPMSASFDDEASAAEYMRSLAPQVNGSTLDLITEKGITYMIMFLGVVKVPAQSDKTQSFGLVEFETNPADPTHPRVRLITTTPDWDVVLDAFEKKVVALSNISWSQWLEFAEHSSGGPESSAWAELGDPEELQDWYILKHPKVLFGGWPGFLMNILEDGKESDHWKCCVVIQY
jgi:hypothetical protein